MGGIALFSMHFIGNRAIILGNGEQEIQIAYNRGYTALSGLVPIVVLFVSFGVIGSNEVISIVRIALGGILAGLGSCSVYYLGQAGILNYDCTYSVASVVGSALVAIVVSVGSLGVFFFFRSSWDAIWWKRASCAFLLAGAVSGMNWLACTGTSYRLKTVLPSTSQDISTTTPVIIIIILVSLGTSYSFNI